MLDYFGFHVRFKQKLIPFHKEGPKDGKAIRREWKLACAVSEITPIPLHYLKGQSFVKMPQTIVDRTSSSLCFIHSFSGLYQWTNVVKRMLQR